MRFLAVAVLRGAALWRDSGARRSTWPASFTTRPSSGPPGRRSERCASTLRGGGSCGPGSTRPGLPRSFATPAPSRRCRALAGWRRRPRWRPCGASRPARAHAHGSSRWATTAEMQRAGLAARRGRRPLPDERRRVSNDRRRARARPARPLRRLGALVRHDGPEHVFCFAPTRSGKGVGLVIPTLLSWPHSVLVYDIKKENWALTAGWRRQFSRDVAVRADGHRFGALQPAARDPQGTLGGQGHPERRRHPRRPDRREGDAATTGRRRPTPCSPARSCTCSTPKPTRRSPASRPSSRTRRGTQRANARSGCSRRRHLPSGPAPVVAQAAREMLNKSDNELSGVFSTAMACLGLYRDPVVARNTAASDFRIADLMNADAPVEPLPGRAAERPRAHPSHHPPDAQPDRTPPDRVDAGRGQDRLPAPPAAPARRVSRRSAGSSSSRPRSRSSPATASRPSSSRSRSTSSRRPTARTTPSSTTATSASRTPPTTTGPPGASPTCSARPPRRGCRGATPARASF